MNLVRKFMDWNKNEIHTFWAIKHNADDIDAGCHAINER